MIKDFKGLFIVKILGLYYRCTGHFLKDVVKDSDDVLAATADLYVTMSACRSVCRQQVLWKCYDVVSVPLLLLLL